MAEVDIRYWKVLERHPLSAEYDDLSGPQWDAFLATVKEFGIVGNRKITIHEGKILDGWQLQRACVECDTKPNYQSLPKGVTPDKFVEVSNDLRRKEESPEAVAKRVASRRDRVVTKRQEGTSIREIAEEEGVSPATVQKDLATATAHGVQSEPADGKVVGKDGKTRDASKPKILCDRCARVGAVPGCPQCKDMREKKKSKPKIEPEKDESVAVDDFRKPLPKGCRKAYLDPWITEVIDFLVVMESDIRKERIADGAMKRKELQPFLKHKDVVDSIGQIQNGLEQLIGHLKENRIAGVCPACEGEKCSKCKMGGLVPRELHAELKAKVKESKEKAKAG